MKIHKIETQKRLLFLHDFFSNNPEASCRSAQKALKETFGQAMRPLVVTSVKAQVIEAQNSAIVARNTATIFQAFGIKALPDVQVELPDLTQGSSEPMLITGCGGDCSKCECGGK
jgi:hypothetical protein